MSYADVMRYDAGQVALLALGAFLIAMVLWCVLLALWRRLRLTIGLLALWLYYYKLPAGDLRAVLRELVPGGRASGDKDGADGADGAQ